MPAGGSLRTAGASSCRTSSFRERRLPCRSPQSPRRWGQGPRSVTCSLTLSPPREAAAARHRLPLWGHREEGSAPCGGAGGQTGSLSSRGAAERFRRLTEAEEKLDEAPKPGPVTWEAGAWPRPQRASSGQNPELSHQRQLRPRKRH